MIRLAIVEDNTPLRESLVLLLGGEPAIEVVADFGTAEEALEALGEEPTDAVLIDIGLPGMTGIDLIKRLKGLHPSVQFMVHTIHEDRGNVFAAIKAGAEGYILKGATPRELVESILDLSKGGAPMSPKIARAVIREFQGSDPSQEYILTAREKEILRHLEEGLTYKVLAERLSVSHHTIHTHIKHIYEKLHAKGRNDALSKARVKGII